MDSRVLLGMLTVGCRLVCAYGAWCGSAEFESGGKEFSDLLQAEQEGVDGLIGGLVGGVDGEVGEAAVEGVALVEAELGLGGVCKDGTG